MARMGGRSRGSWAALVAFALAVSACASGPKPRVLGTSIVATTTSTTSSSGSTSTTSTTAAPSTSTTTTASPAVATTTRPPASTTPARPPTPTTTTTAAGESLAPGTYEERTDQANSYAVAEDGSSRAGAVATVRRDAPERADVTVLYYGESVEVQLTNLAGRTFAFPDGAPYRAAVECRRDGALWRTATAEAPAVTSVDADATVSAVVDLPADGPGNYACTATITIVLP